MQRLQRHISISVVLPAFNDSQTLPSIIQNLMTLLPRLSRDFEIIVVDDGSSDATPRVLKELQAKYRIRVITHETNKGYGGALLSGFYNATKEYIFYTDSDGQYDVSELQKLVNSLSNKLDMVSGYKIKRHDPWIRKIVGACYNQAVHMLFQLPVRDIDCDFRIFKRSLLQNLHIQTMTGAFDVAFIHALKKQNIRVKNIPVHHYKREYGQSQFFTLKHITNSIRDVSLLWIKKAGK